MPIKKTVHTFELSPFPSTYFATDVEVTFLCRLLNNSKLIGKPFSINSLSKVASTLDMTKTEQETFLQSLARQGFIYSFSKDHTNLFDNSEQQLDYFLHAEKTVQAIINHFPNQVIGKKLCKFEADGKILDGGFVSNDADIFRTIMLRVDAYYGNRDHQASYLPSFIRLYECIGTADGSDFFRNSKRGLTKSQSQNTDLDDKHSNNNLSIPKYVVLKRRKSDASWVSDNQRICVCIS